MVDWSCLFKAMSTMRFPSYMVKLLFVGPMVAIKVNSTPSSIFKIEHLAYLNQEIRALEVAIRMVKAKWSHLLCLQLRLIYEEWIAIFKDNIT